MVNWRLVEILNLKTDEGKHRKIVWLKFVYVINFSITFSKLNSKLAECVPMQKKFYYHPMLAIYCFLIFISHLKNLDEFAKNGHGIKYDLQNCIKVTENANSYQNV